MSALLDSLAAGFEGDGTRRAALDAALRDGLPGPRTESWKYTSLRALERRAFASAAQPACMDPALLGGIPAPRLVFVNGVFDAGASDLGTPETGLLVEARTDIASPGDLPADAPFARLNLLLATTGASIRVDAGMRVAHPVHLVCIGTPLAADAAWHLRHRIVLGEGALCAVVEHHFASGEHAHLTTETTEVLLGTGSALRHARVQDEATGATLFARTDATLARDADYRRIDLELGAALSRHELNVRLEGEGAKLRADGVLLAEGRRHVDTRLGIEHIARDTASSLAWRGLGAGRSRAAFHGGIVIRAGADGSEAVLSNKNLLLSEHAEIDTQPVLEIHADEVKAAHGATVGQLDPNALFYLRSRGIPEIDAHRLLTAAFCREIVAGIDDETLRSQLDPALDRALARIQM